MGRARLITVAIAMNMGQPVICILAAGLGSRLGPATQGIPKSMVPVCGKPILARQLAELDRCGVPESSIRIVTGHAAAVIRDFLPDRLVTIYNPEYARYNNIYSVHLLREHVGDDMVLINGDTLFHPQLMSRLLANNQKACLVIDDVKPLGEEEMKTEYRHGRLCSISKSIDPQTSSGEYIGLCRFRAEALEVYFHRIGEMIAAGQTDGWYEGAMNGIVDRVDIGMTSTRGLPWIEIDTPADLLAAEELMCNQLDSASRD